MLASGDNIGGYVIESTLGEGGMAVVYKVRHAERGTIHAIKVLAVRSADVQKRLLKEGKVQSRLKHRNVVQVNEILEHDGMPVLVMEYIEGPSLHDLLSGSPPDLEEALYMFRGIVRGMAAAHRKGIVHRDLKPANVLLAVVGDRIEPKIADFGLVKSVEGKGGGTRPGTAMGTPQYMAPEQVRDASTVDRRADLFSLGVILYELVCGRRPFDGPNMVAVLNVVMVCEYVDPAELVPDIPPEVRTAIQYLLTRKPEDRLSSCEDVLKVLDGEPPPLDRPPPKAWKSAKKTKAAASAPAPEPSKKAAAQATTAGAAIRWTAPVLSAAAFSMFAVIVFLMALAYSLGAF